MILKEQRILFVHIPKTAGSSIEKAFCEHYGVSLDDALVIRNNDLSSRISSNSPSSFSHLTIQEYPLFTDVTQEDLSDYFKFTFVRNPWSRLISEYKWHRYYLKYSFRDWLFRFFPTEENMITIKDDLRWRHVMPQWRYIFDNSGNSLVDYIGHFESLNEDFQTLEKLLGCKLPPLSRVKENKMTGNNTKRLIKRILSKNKIHEYYKDYYDRETWDWVGNFYRRDIELFGYNEKF